MNSRGVSPVVGVILMVAVVVLLSSLVLISVNNFDTSENPPLVASESEIYVESYDSGPVQVFSVMNLNGDSIKKENLRVRLEGTDAEINNAVFVDNGVFDDGTWDPGEELIVKISTEGLCLEEGDDFQYMLVHEPTKTAFASQDITVKKEFDFEIIDREKIKSNQRYSAKIELLGTELSSANTDEKRFVYNPITTKITIGSETVIPWPSSEESDDDVTIQHDVNDPEEASHFNYNTKKISAEKTLSVAVTSWTGNYDVTDNYINKGGGSYSDIVPTSLGKKHLTVSTDSNSSNLVLLTDGEKIPDPETSGIKQKSAEEILSGKTKKGKLKLKDNQVVAFVELSTIGASTDNARSLGDPDYNDAIFLITLRGEDDISEVMSSEDGDPTKIVCTQDG